MTRPGATRFSGNRLKRSAVGLCVAAASLALLITAAMLTPSEDGHGTHEGLGLAPCGWAMAFDTPCVTCGMTTSFSWMARGDGPAGFATQPAGALLAVLSAAAGWAGLYQAVSGRRCLGLFGFAVRGRWLIVWGLLLLAAWGYKVLTWGG